MLFKATEHISKNNNLEKDWKGIVVDNKDPKKLGRVKCNVKGIYDAVPADLPWVYPHNSTFGGKNNCLTFAVPEIGAELNIRFPHKDALFPVYTGHLQNDSTHNSLFDEDYPDTYGHIDSTNYYWKYNKKKKELFLSHPGRVTIKIDKNGLVEIISESGEINIKAGGEINIKAGGDITIKSDSNVNLEGSTGKGKGVVTGDHICAFTNKPHMDYSKSVNASK